MHKSSQNACEQSLEKVVRFVQAQRSRPDSPAPLEPVRLSHVHCPHCCWKAGGAKPNIPLRHRRVQLLFFKEKARPSSRSWTGRSTLPHRVSSAGEQVGSSLLRPALFFTPFFAWRLFCYVFRCFDRCLALEQCPKTVYKYPVLREALNTMSQPPSAEETGAQLPLLLMRTVMVSVTTFPELKNFVATVVLVRLVQQKVWWSGHPSRHLS